jgi:hypothetical protein
MKARIIGTILVLAILGGVYVLTYDENQVRTTNSPQSEPAFAPLKIN